MRRKSADPGERAAIEAGLTWFERSTLFGWRPVKRDGRNLWEQGASATEPMWARFYDLHTNEPIFAGAQDGIVYDSFETMARNNRFGYAFFTPKAQVLLGKEQAAWRGGRK
jgi:PelA/Pel-15E family pectate lyase